MFGRFGVLCVVGALVLVGCSSSEVDGPEVTVSAGSATTVVETTVVETTVVETTVVDEFDLGSVLDGEPPSTTVSVDAGEQAAADSVYWWLQTFEGCLADLSGCDVTNFEQTIRTGPFLTGWVDYFEELQQSGSYIESGLPSEDVVLWSRTSSASADVVGVLGCSRNHYVAFDSDDNVINSTSPLALALWRVVRGDDGRWRVSGTTTIIRFQPEPGSDESCADFDGSEVSDKVFAEAIG